MLANIRWPELIILLVVVLLIFGVGRISKVAGEMGNGIRAFKEGITGEKDKKKEEEDETSEEEEK
jgi:sec-independent protein translocase protein TatA